MLGASRTVARVDDDRPGTEVLMVAGTTDSRLARRVALGCAVAAGLAFVVLYLAAIRTRSGQEADIRLYTRAQIGDGELDAVAGTLRVLVPAGLAVLAAGLGLVALVRRRWAPIVSAAAIVVLSVGLDRALRDVVLDRPYLGDLGDTHNTLPSGHVGATTALAVAVVVLWPWRWRVVPILLAVLATGVVSAATVVTRTHRPSDALGAVLVVVAITAVVAWASSRRRDRPGGDAPPGGHPAESTG